MLLPIISSIITLIVATVRFIIPRRESRDKLEVEKLEHRIKELNNNQRIEFAREARKLENEITIIQKRLRGYPNTILFLNFLTVLTTLATVMTSVNAFFNK